MIFKFYDVDKVKTKSRFTSSICNNNFIAPSLGYSGWLESEQIIKKKNLWDFLFPDDNQNQGKNKFEKVCLIKNLTHGRKTFAKINSNSIKISEIINFCYRDHFKKEKNGCHFKL